MSKEVVFPSEEWFTELAGRMEANPAIYRKLGAIDCTMVVKVAGEDATELYELVFESFGVKSIRKLRAIEDAAHGHFVLSAPLLVWREMIENIRANQGPDLKHTLNYLTFPDDPMLVDGPDQLEVDAFYRYNESLQQFFNEALDVATTFAS